MSTSPDADTPGTAGGGTERDSDRWEHFPHGADVGVRGVGNSIARAFENAAVALTAVVTDPSSVEARTPIEIHCSAADEELLLVEWLDSLVYEMSTRKMLFSRFGVHMEGACNLNARVWGEEVDVARHQPTVEVKGATLTALRVSRVDDGSWVAECVVDV